MAGGGPKKHAKPAEESGLELTDLKKQDSKAVMATSVPTSYKLPVAAPIRIPQPNTSMTTQWKGLSHSAPTSLSLRVPRPEELDLSDDDNEFVEAKPNEEKPNEEKPLTLADFTRKEDSGFQVGSPAGAHPHKYRSFRAAKK